MRKSKGEELGRGRRGVGGELGRVFLGGLAQTPRAAADEWTADGSRLAASERCQQGGGGWGGDMQRRGVF